MSFQIDRGLSIPPMRFATSQYPLAELDVGESFFVPGGEDLVKTRASLSAAIANHYRRNKSQRRFTVRTVTEGDVKGLRVWCIANPEQAADAAE